MNVLNEKLMECLLRIKPTVRYAYATAIMNADCGLYDECGCGGSCGTTCSGGCDDSCNDTCYYKCD